MGDPTLSSPCKRYTCPNQDYLSPGVSQDLLTSTSFIPLYHHGSLGKNKGARKASSAVQENDAQQSTRKRTRRRSSCTHQSRKSWAHVYVRLKRRLRTFKDLRRCPLLLFARMAACPSHLNSCECRETKYVISLREQA